MESRFLQWSVIKLKKLFIITLLLFLFTISDVTLSHTKAAEKLNDNQTIVNSYVLGGITSVDAQLREDERIKIPIWRFSRIDHFLSPWFFWKENLKKSIGLQLGMDYQALYQAVTHSLTNENDAASGVFRIYGKWILLNRHKKNEGALIFKIENRHRFTSIPPSMIGDQFGYVGVPGVLFSNINTVINTLYWEQYLFENRMGFAIGRLDPTDFIDISGYANPWTTFQNLSILFDPSIAFPDTGMGAVGSVWLYDMINIGGGIYDANGMMTEFGFFQHGSDFFEHIEVGYSPTQKERLIKNIHLIFWQVDERKHANIPRSHGVGMSVNWLFKKKWEPFIKLGISTGTASLMKKSMTVGAIYSLIQNSDVVGLGFHLGEPSNESIRKKQYTTELFFRLQLAKNLAITPDIQWIYHPANNPQRERVWLFGIRARLTL